MKQETQMLETVLPGDEEPAHIQKIIGIQVSPQIHIDLPMRDLLAGLALRNIDRIGSPAAIAARAYSIADAMVNERDRVRVAE